MDPTQSQAAAVLALLAPALRVILRRYLESEKERPFLLEAIEALARMATLAVLEQESRGDARRPESVPSRMPTPQARRAAERELMKPRVVEALASKGWLRFVDFRPLAGSPSNSVLGLHLRGLVRDGVLEKVSRGIYAKPGVSVTLDQERLAAPQPGTLSRRLLDIVEARPGHPFSTSEIYRALGSDSRKLGSGERRVARTLLSQLAKNGSIARIGLGFYGVGDPDAMKVPQRPTALRRERVLAFLRIHAGRGVRSVDIRNNFPGEHVSEALSFLRKQRLIKRPRATVYGVPAADGSLVLPAPARSAVGHIARIVALLRAAPEREDVPPGYEPPIFERLRALGTRPFLAKELEPSSGRRERRLRDRLNALTHEGCIRRLRDGRYRVRRLPAPPLYPPEHIRRRGVPVRDIVQHLGLTLNATSGFLLKAIADGTVVRVGLGWYAAVE